MRRYSIKITKADGSPYVKTFGEGSDAFNFDGEFSSTDASGNVTNPNALNIELDVPVSIMNTPMGGTAIRVWGIGKPMIAESVDLNPSIDGTKYFNIEVAAGMAKNGLPLSNGEQYKTIVKGRILQAYGNWQGTSQTLDFILMPFIGTNKEPLDFSFKCEKGTPLKNAIEITLRTAFHGLVEPKDITVNISDKLIPVEDAVNKCKTLVDFNNWLNNLSKSILKNSDYSGIQITYMNGAIAVYDNNNLASKTPKQIKFEDLIGQPTWMGIQTMVFKVVMRGDIQVGDVIKMPKKSLTTGTVLGAPGSYPQFRDKLTFLDNFWVTQIRHTGNYRQPTGDSWVTTIYAALVTAPKL